MRVFYIFLVAFCIVEASDDFENSLRPWYLHQRPIDTSIMQNFTPEDSYQEYVLNCFFGQTQDVNFLYLRGVYYSKKATTFTLLNTHWNNDEKFKDTLLQEDADIICLQQLPSDNEAYDLYKQFKNHYAHFYISLGEKSFFIASKFALSSPTFHCNIFDFTVKSNNNPISHIYVANDDLSQVVAKMQSDCLNSKSDMPFFLCCESDNIELLQDYFCYAKSYKSSHILILQQPSDYTMLDIATEYSDNYLLTTVNLLQKLPISLCDWHGEAKVEAKSDSKGNSEASVSVKEEYEHKCDDGSSVSVGAEATGKVDNQGNCSGEIRGNVRYTF